jgi:N-acyl amino acid synthase of PEP-CTERM/exosortase system
MEYDIHDTHSVHFGIQDQDGILVGTVRLVLDDRCYGFPIEKHCIIEMRDKLDPINSLAEVSRLVVSKKYRRRRTDGLTGAESYLEREYRRRRPEVVFKLYEIMYQESVKLGITHWYAAMEKTLWRVLEMFGIVFTQVGPKIDYWGPVYPYLLDLEEAIKRLEVGNPDLYQEFGGQERIALAAS